MPPASSRLPRQVSTAALPLAIETVLANASSSSHVIARAGTGLAPARPAQAAPTPSLAVAAAVARVLQASCRLGNPGGSGSSRGPCNGAGGAHNPTGLLVGGDGRTAVSQGTGSGKPVTGRTAGHQWQPHELEMVLAAALRFRAAQHFNSASGGADNGTPHGLQLKRAPPAPHGEVTKMVLQLGWDPADVRARNRLRSKLSQVRARLDHGQSPQEVVSTTRRARSVNLNLRWRVWCRDALRSLPGNQGTSNQVCAVLLANPKIAPLLDHRVHTGQRSVAHWHHAVFAAIAKIPGVVKTGEKRDGRVVYRLDCQAAELLQAAAKRRRTTQGGKGQASMPHLGAGQ